MSWLRRRRLPAGWTTRLAREERVVAWAGASGDGAVVGTSGDGAVVGTSGGGGVMVVTNLGLWLPGAAERLGWHEIHKVNWSSPRLTVIGAREVSRAERYVTVEDGPPTRYTLAGPGRVPEQVRARVTRSVAFSEHYPLPVGGGVRVVGRRVPGIDGVSWAVRYDEGTDSGADQVRGLTETYVARAVLAHGGAILG
jgi:hypothetical protein